MKSQQEKDGRGKQADTSGWIVVDRAGQPHARITHAGYSTAVALVRTTFPEFAEGELRVIAHHKAWSSLRATAKSVVVLTPARCAARGITWPPQVQVAAERLQTHFPHVRANDRGRS